MTRTRLAGVAFAVALLGAACGGGEGSTDSVALTEPSVPIAGAADAADVSVPALDFTAPTVSGGELTGTDYAGTDTILWFWAPW